MDQEQTRLDNFPTRLAEAACDESDWTLAAAQDIAATQNETGWAPVELIQDIIREHIEPGTTMDMQVAAGASVNIPQCLDTLIITAAEGSTINVQNDVHELAIEQGNGSRVIFADGAMEATIIQGPGSVIQYNRGRP